MSQVLPRDAAWHDAESDRLWRTCDIAGSKLLFTDNQDMAATIEATT